jgi:superfamily II DNA or RNA helicase
MTATVTPRPYQRAALDAAFGQLQSHNVSLVVLPTGCGKTVLFSVAAAEWFRPRRVMVAAHTNVLVRQAREELEKFTGERVGTEQGGLKADRRVNVSSVQTLDLRLASGAFDPDGYGLLVVDEAHHAASGQWRRVIARFVDAGAKVLMVTATPNRADGVSLGVVADAGRAAYTMGLREAMEESWLAPVRCSTVDVLDFDFEKVATRGGDFADAALAAAIAERKPWVAMAEPIVDISAGRRALVFCASVEQARLMAELINAHDPKSAAHIHGGTPPDEREKLIKAFKAGGVRYLCNCAVLTEGFDVPDAGVVAMCRPTKSLPLYQQMLGRVTRTQRGAIDGIDTAAGRAAAIAASGKTHGMVIDFVGNAAKHKIVTPLDALAGVYPDGRTADAVRAAADVYLKMGADAMKAVRLAEAEVARPWSPRDFIDPTLAKGLRDDLTRMAAAGVKVRTTYLEREVAGGVFGEAGETHATRHQAAAGGQRMAEQWQIDRLKRDFRFSDEKARRMTFRGAWAVLNRKQARAA